MRRALVLGAFAVAAFAVGFALLSGIGSTEGTVPTCPDRMAAMVGTPPVISDPSSIPATPEAAAHELAANVKSDFDVMLNDDQIASVQDQLSSASVGDTVTVDLGTIGGTPSLQYSYARTEKGFEWAGRSFCADVVTDSPTDVPAS